MTSLAHTTRIAYKVGVDVTARAAMLVVTIAAARTLSRDAFGVLALAIATGWLLGVASDMGLPLYLARETARGGRALRHTLAAVVGLRFALLTVALGAAVLAGWWWTPAGSRLAFTLIVMAQVIGAALETIGHLFRGLDRSELEAHLHLAQRLVMTIAALTVLTLAPDLTRLALALVIPPLAAVPIALLLARTLARSSAVESTDRLQSSAQPPTWASVARDAAPLGLGILVSALYFRIDVFFVERWHGLAAVAGYSAVFAVVGAVRLLPAAVLAVMFPTLCRAEDAAAVSRMARWLTAAGVAVAAAIAASASMLVVAIYGPLYADAASVLRILAAAVPLFFLNYALTHQVIGWNRQRAYLFIASAALVANVVANLMLVPEYGPSGAAAATGLTELVVTGGCVWVLADQQRVRRANAVARGVS